MRQFGSCIDWLLIVMIFVLIGGSTTVVRASRCGDANAHIRATFDDGNTPVAKLLVDTAIENFAFLRCSDREVEELTELQRKIYSTYVTDLLRIARDDIDLRKDGRSAVRNIDRASYTAYLLEISLPNFYELYVQALFFASHQNLADAAVAEQEGDLDLRDELRETAEIQFFRALFLDPSAVSQLQERNSAIGSLEK